MAKKVNNNDNNLHEFDKEIQNYLIENQDEDLLKNPSSLSKPRNDQEIDTRLNKYNYPKIASISEDPSMENTNSNYKKVTNSNFALAIKKPAKLFETNPNQNLNSNSSRVKFMEYMDNVKENTESYQKKLLELAQARVDIDNKHKKIGDLENIKHILLEEKK